MYTLVVFSLMALQLLNVTNGMMHFKTIYNNLLAIMSGLDQVAISYICIEIHISALCNWCFVV